MFSNASLGRGFGVGGIYQAQQETGVRKSDRVAGQESLTATGKGSGTRRAEGSRRNNVWKRRLRAAKSVRAVERPGVDIVVSLVAQFPAELESMVVLDPGDTRDCGELLKEVGDWTGRRIPGR